MTELRAGGTTPPGKELHTLSQSMTAVTGSPHFLTALPSRVSASVLRAWLVIARVIESSFQTVFSAAPRWGTRSEASSR